MGGCCVVADLLEAKLLLRGGIKFLTSLNI